MKRRNDVTPRRLPKTRAATAVLAITLAAGLTACARDPSTTGSLPTDGYRSAYPIVVAEGEETLDIPVGFGSAGLSASMRDTVRSFGFDAAKHATSTVVVQTPAGSGNQAAAQHVAREVRAELLRAGVSKGMVESRSYPASNPQAAAPVRVSFSRIKAMSPECGKWAGPILPDWQNEVPVEFGCATQANFAAMIENPEDLLHPRASTPTPAGRRYFIWKQWQGSETTSTEQSLQTAETTEEN
jgi:pilus assembly protein CpaD